LQDAIRVDDFIDDVRTVFAAADALLVPSRHEAYGLVTVEALGAGVPVIGSASGATEDLLKGGAGLLADPEQSSEFADHVRALLGDPELRARLTATGRTRAATLHPDAEADAVRETLDAICPLSRQRSEP
jgi:glycosyltransferase involved in cell wall biosynthesis